MDMPLGAVARRIMTRILLRKSNSDGFEATRMAIGDAGALSHFAAATPAAAARPAPAAA